MMRTIFKLKSKFPENPVVNRLMEYVWQLYQDIERTLKQINPALARSDCTTFLNASGKFSFECDDTFLPGFDFEIRERRSVGIISNIKKALEENRQSLKRSEDLQEEIPAKRTKNQQNGFNIKSRKYI